MSNVNSFKNFLQTTISIDDLSWDRLKKVFCSIQAHVRGQKEPKPANKLILDNQEIIIYSSAQDMELSGCFCLRDKIKKILNSKDAPTSKEVIIADQNNIKISSLSLSPSSSTSLSSSTISPEETIDSSLNKNLFSETTNSIKNSKPIIVQKVSPILKIGQDSYDESSSKIVEVIETKHDESIDEKLDEDTSSSRFKIPKFSVSKKRKELSPEHSNDFLLKEKRLFPSSSGHDSHPLNDLSDKKKSSIPIAIQNVEKNYREDNRINDISRKYDHKLTYDKRERREERFSYSRYNRNLFDNNSYNNNMPHNLNKYGSPSRYLNRSHYSPTYSGREDETLSKRYCRSSESLNMFRTHPYVSPIHFHDHYHDTHNSYNFPNIEPSQRPPPTAAYYTNPYGHNLVSYPVLSRLNIFPYFIPSNEPFRMDYAQSIFPDQPFGYPIKKDDMESM